MVDYPESFASYPESITERKSNLASENNATIITPRDALITILRKIDEGMPIDALVIAYRIPTETRGIASMAYFQAVPDNETAIGILFRAAQMISRDGE
jgi:hypothetical protein